MSIGVPILVVVAVLALVLFPAWPYSRRLGWYPTGWLTIFALIVLYLVLTRQL